MHIHSKGTQAVHPRKHYRFRGDAGGTDAVKVEREYRLRGSTACTIQAQRGAGTAWGCPIGR